MDSVHTSNPYEEKYGYSRAVRRGPFIFVSGTTSVDITTPGLSVALVLHPNSAYKQALAVFAEIVSAVEALGGSKADVVRVRMFVTRHEDTDDVGRALKEVFEDVPTRPAATMVIGAAFVLSQMLVEIEADAVVLWFVVAIVVMFGLTSDIPIVFRVVSNLSFTGPTTSM